MPCKAFYYFYNFAHEYKEWIHTNLLNFLYLLHASIYALKNFIAISRKINLKMTYSVVFHHSTKLFVLFSWLLFDSLINHQCHILKQLLIKVKGKVSILFMHVYKYAYLQHSYRTPLYSTLTLNFIFLTFSVATYQSV